MQYQFDLASSNYPLGDLTVRVSLKGVDVALVSYKDIDDHNPTMNMGVTSLLPQDPQLTSLPGIDCALDLLLITIMAIEIPLSELQCEMFQDVFDNGPVFYDVPCLQDHLGA